MGFPKLKNFLMIMEDDVVLEEYNKNHIKVKLKNMPRYTNKRIKSLNLNKKKSKKRPKKGRANDLIRNL